MSYHRLLTLRINSKLCWEQTTVTSLPTITCQIPTSTDLITSCVTLSFVSIPRHHVPLSLLLSLLISLILFQQLAVHQTKLVPRDHVRISLYHPNIYTNFRVLRHFCTTFVCHLSKDREACPGKALWTLAFQLRYLINVFSDRKVVNYCSFTFVTLDLSHVLYLISQITL